ncbi:GNAT family N-acetyltransferase [Ectobacillus ponti]|uniref:GNAT family N-acetyltransferase n=1 Tax=Ectobacillus ponti TaxID=2961894 RepID=A0AA42BQ09_9BACI|nr:GNAT family N-acetyltransferase [Ectobacillus ponti]MCP8968921.1 GNAT family N-acetyltransferase [Ectobacillus ponti]
MIRKLCREDHGRVYAFLAEEPSFNLFLLGDLEAFGYEQAFQELWGDFTEDGALRAVLLRYYDSFVPYAKGEFDAAGLARCMIGYEGFTLSGKAAVTEAFEHVQGLSLGKKRSMYFCECRDAAAAVLVPAHGIKRAHLEDASRIVSLRHTIEDFVVPPDAEERFRKSMTSKTGRTYYIQENGQAVASAATAAENSMSAMVVAVCTHPDFRQKGYASRVVAQMIRDITAEGKTLCLFYDNPDAGRIYKRLGFQDIGMWNMYR